MSQVFQHEVYTLLCIFVVVNKNIEVITTAILLITFNILQAGNDRMSVPSSSVMQANLWHKNYFIVRVCMQLFY